MHDLVAGEAEAAAVARDEQHVVVEPPRLDRVLVLAHEPELALGDVERFGRQMRGIRGAGQRAGMAGIAEEGVDIVDQHVHREGEPLPDQLAGLGRGFIVAVGGVGDIAMHALGEGDAGGAVLVLRRNERDHRCVGVRRVGQRATEIAGEMDHRALGERRDRQQWIDAERARDDGAIANVEALVDRVRVAGCARRTRARYRRRRHGRARPP